MAKIYPYLLEHVGTCSWAFHFPQGLGTSLLPSLPKERSTPASSYPRPLWPSRYEGAFPYPATVRAMRKCARTGCPRPQHHPSTYGLALCHHHEAQYAAGTLGADHDPRVREYPACDLWDICQATRLPKETDRALARRLNVPKDVIHHIRHHHWPVVRSEGAEALLDGVAHSIYQQHFHREYDEKITTDGKRTAQQQQRRYKAKKELKATLQQFKTTTQKEEKEKEKEASITKLNTKQQHTKEGKQLKLFAA